MIYFSFGAFTTLVVRGHRRTKLRGHRRQAERERDQYEEKARKRERRREAMGQSQDSSCLCSRQMSTHLITTPGGVTEQLVTAGTATFITYTLILGNRNYYPSTDRW